MHYILYVNTVFLPYLSGPSANRVLHNIHLMRLKIFNPDPNLLSSLSSLSGCLAVQSVNHGAGCHFPLDMTRDTSRS